MSSFVLCVAVDIHTDSCSVMVILSISVRSILRCYPGMPWHNSVRRKSAPWCIDTGFSFLFFHINA